MVFYKLQKMGCIGAGGLSESMDGDVLYLSLSYFYASVSAGYFSGQRLCRTHSTSWGIYLTGSKICGDTSRRDTMICCSVGDVCA